MGEREPWGEGAEGPPRAASVNLKPLGPEGPPPLVMMEAQPAWAAPAVPPGDVGPALPAARLLPPPRGRAGALGEVGAGFQPQSRDCRLVSEGQEQVGQVEGAAWGSWPLTRGLSCSPDPAGSSGFSGLCVCDTCGVQLAPEKRGLPLLLLLSRSSLMNSSCRGPDQAEVRRHLPPPPRQQEGSALPTTLGCFSGLRWS